MTYDSALNLELTAVGNETPLSDTCTDIDFRYVGKGCINVPATGAYQKNFDDVPVTISGRVELSIESGHLFEGECASALQSLSDCLKNSSACAKSSDYARAQNIFGFYLEKELLTLDDIPYVSLLGVQVNYE
ncbi:MAG TPA: hypothetical protein DCS07_10610 [Bdellovibrionales bacterium]|nr:hypothetical protein [Bdellovibrionales bacterium]